MAVLHQERFSSGSTGDPVPVDTAVTVKLKKDDSTWKSSSTDADGFVSFDLQTTATLLPGPYYLEIEVGDVTKRVHSDVYGVQGRELIGQAQSGAFFINGVVDNQLNEMAVSAPGSGMTVRVATGLFNIQGTVAPVNTLVTLTHDAAHGSLARIDRVIVRLYLDATDFGKVELAILKGTAAASPTAVSLTQSTSTVWEEMLADVSITAALGTILTGNLTDRRTFAGPSVIGSVIQTALDLKSNLASPTFTGTVTLPAVTQSGTITANSVAITPTELGYIGTLTSDAQTQLTAQTAALALKANLASPTFTGTVTLPSTVVIPDATLAIADTSGLQTALDAKADESGGLFTGLTKVTANGDPVFVVEGSGGTDILYITQTYNAVQVVNGAEFSTVNGVPGVGTKTFAIDGATGNVTVGGVTLTPTELSYLDGVSSNIQTQLSAKAPSSGATLTGATITSPTITGATLTTANITASAGLRHTGGTWGFNGNTVSGPQNDPDDVSSGTVDATWGATEATVLNELRTSFEQLVQLLRDVGIVGA